MVNKMNKQELLQRYASAKLTKYLKTIGGEHEAKVATQFALDDLKAEYDRYCRTHNEQYALEILLMEVEDAEQATNN